MKFKKVISISFILAIGVCIGVTNCSATEKNKNIVVLENQQRDINDVLAIKKIDKIENFAGYYWLDNGKILGIKGKSIKAGNEEVSNICIYNTKNGEIQNLTNNTDNNYKIYLRIIDITKDEKYILYSKTILSNDKKNIYLIDIKTGIEKKIEDGFNGRIKFTDENEIIATKGMKIYEYDLNGNKKDIELPEELVEKMKDFSKLSCEEFIKKRGIEDKDLDEDYKNNLKEMYEYQTKNNRIFNRNKKGDEVYLETYNQIPFLYNLKTNEYREITELEAKEFGLHEKKIKYVAKLKDNDSGGRELWELDSNWKNKKLIAKGDLRGGIQISPDNSKVAYSIYGEKGNITQFIYDLKTGKSISILQKISSAVFWDKSSKQFYVLSIKIIKKDNKEYRYFDTSIVTLN